MLHWSVFTSTVPGAVPSQSLRATPFEDRILLYWKEPTEPNGIIIQYEVLLRKKQKQKCLELIITMFSSKWLITVPFGSLSIDRSATVVSDHLTLRYLSSGRGSQCPSPRMRHITSSLSSTQVSHTSSPYARPLLKGLVLQPRWMWRQIFQVTEYSF